MLRYVLVVVLAGAWADPASAQSPDYRSFLPLAPGNAWTYDVTHTNGSSQSSSSSLSGERWTVLDSVTVAAGRFPRVRIESEGSDHECLVRTEVRASETGFYFLDPTGDAPCAADISAQVEDTTIGLVPGFELTSDQDLDIVIGGENYGVRRAGEWWSFGSDELNIWAVENIGVLSHQYYHLIGTGYWTRRYSRLRWTNVGGQLYGQAIAFQPEFWPLAVGNRWQYHLTSNGVDRGAVVWTVVPDGDEVAVRFEHIENDQVAASATCPVTVAAPSLQAGWPTRFRIECSTAAEMLYPVAISLDLFDADQVIRIGTDDVIVDRASGENSSYGQYHVTISRWQAGRDIGIVEYERYNQTGGVVHYDWTATLQYAVVSGVEYGQQIVATGDGASPARLALRAGPNPVSGRLTVRYALPSPADARLAVVDALGREVRTADLGARPAGDGAETLALDGLSPGVYTIRLTAGEASATTRISVVR